MVNCSSCPITSGDRSVDRELWKLAFIVSILAALAGCGQGDQKQPSQRLVEGGIALPDPSLKFITVEPVGEKEIASGARVPARLVVRPHATASVGAPASGRVAAVLVRPGQAVRTGEVLVTLHSADAAAARAALAQASARAGAAEETLRRYTEMVAKGVGLELERIEAETKTREARAELERARRASALIGEGGGELVSVLAPRAGLVMSVKTAVGAMVAPGGEALVEIGDGSRLWAVADVSEADIGLVAKGRRVLVSIPGAKEPLAGTVDGLGSRIEPDTRRLPVYIALQADTAGLAPGMQVELEFPAGARGLSLPVTAVLIKDGTRRIVYVRRSDGRFEAREVRTGAVTAGRVPILEGLQAGENVVVKGALLLDGESEQLL